jgi:hypothetical protein
MEAKPSRTKDSLKQPRFLFKSLLQLEKLIQLGLISESIFIKSESSSLPIQSKSSSMKKKSF